MDLISAEFGSVTCILCAKPDDASKLKQFAIGHGKSPLDINQKQKGGFSLLKKPNYGTL
jgi:hypothetical protein